MRYKRLNQFQNLKVKGISAKAPNKMLLERLQLYGFAVKCKNVKPKVLSSDSKKVKIYIYNVLAQPVNNNQNNLKVATTKVKGIYKMVMYHTTPYQLKVPKKLPLPFKNTL